jgi:hypothetical protein
MEEDITVARIANAICQDTTFKGIHLLVEGRHDYKLYKKFADENNVRIKTTQGKYRLRAIYHLLAERGIVDVVGIRDADFLRINGNPKYSAQYADAIFPTDCHDAEIMIARNGVLGDYLTLIADPEQVSSFEAKHKIIIDLVFEVIYPIGCLRLANKKFALGLSFKPEKPDGNQIKFRKFVLETTWSVDIAAMVNTVWEYSQNRGLMVASRKNISEALDVIIAEGPPADEISNGHDFTTVLHLLSTRGLKSTNKILHDPSCVQHLLIALFELTKFASTELYSLVQNWSTAKCRPLIFR